MTNESHEEPKLIIDEDWKTQVQREKEELKRQAEKEKQSDQPPAESSRAQDEVSSEPSQDYPPPPPADFSLMVTTFATQAMVALGQMTGEDGKPMPVSLPYARHFIDLIGVLEQKTTGNLDANEQKFLQETLHQMRMLFVAVSKQVSQHKQEK